jgi:hypothetical protein
VKHCCKSEKGARGRQSPHNGLAASPKGGCTCLFQHPSACRTCTEERWHRGSCRVIARGPARRGPLYTCGAVACEHPLCYAFIALPGGAEGEKRSDALGHAIGGLDVRRYAASASGPTLAADRQASASDPMLDPCNPGEHNFSKQQQCVWAIGAAVTSRAEWSEPSIGLAWA